jgi:ribonuclease P protein component
MVLLFYMKAHPETFNKAERLCSIKTIDNLFEKGRSFNLQGLRVVYIISDSDKNLPPARLLITIPKRYFKRAVDRNLLKRRIREVYRKTKETLYCDLINKNKRADIAIVWTGTTIYTYSEISVLIHEMVKKLTR